MITIIFTLPDWSNLPLPRPPNQLAKNSIATRLALMSFTDDGDSHNYKQACSYSRSCLGMCEWTDCPGASAESEPCLPTSEVNEETHPSNSSKRFKFTNENEMEELAKGIIPASTSKATKWAVKTFEQWCSARNSQHQLDSVPIDILTSSALKN